MPRLPVWLLAGVPARRGRPALGGQTAESDVRRDATVLAVEKVMPSVVNIATETIIQVRDPFEEFFRQFWDPYHRRQPPNSQYSLGSGVIIDEEGYLLTNDHVVRRADKITVKFCTGTNVYTATVVASDPKSDVALLKLNARPGEKFKAIQFAREDDLLLGETVLALGNPFGLGGSVSRGILSSKSRIAAQGRRAAGHSELAADRRAHQPGQQRRAAGQLARRVDRHQRRRLERGSRGNGRRASALPSPSGACSKRCRTSSRPSL